MRLPSSYVVLAASLAQVQAQYLMSELSFGTNKRISPEGSQSIPNFSLQGRPNVPELLSDRVILTPVAPGNQRGAVWADKPLPNQNWIADVEFRANGPERAGGNLNIWLVKDGSHVVGSDSVYSAGRFEGLGLLIDQHSGSGGMLRGFLNDGTTDYAHNPDVDSLAFGQCKFTYRNLGRPTQIKLRQTDTNFIVQVAGRTCFQSDKIRIPSGYNFGITAASADNPDSFEIFKLAVLTEQIAQQDSGNNNNNNNEKKPRMNFGRSGQTSVDDPYDNVIPDEDADTITSSKAQFADLHNRLQSVNHHLSTIFRSIGQNAGVGEQRHAEVSAMLGELKGLMNRLEKVDVFEQWLRDIQTEIRSMRQEMAGRLRDSENAIKYHVDDKHQTLAEDVKGHTKSGHARLIWVVIGSQFLLVGVYAYYKRKKISPKKYL
ncbi:concanavalin A-like lectin/glucanase domain-containing protein [Corynascus novoguineensis]|uniref:Concanavalin A-like lectin/glucanase domain-containing protein n=1 Tax=Corynascus novoguineensis TaxID=1126955 RepID=A0AAN7D1M0_9PEZI|nr:concanavalin A-like lectin/glucanase domain-containing protein [Corynascus novoguineensis]